MGRISLVVPSARRRGVLSEGSALTSQLQQSRFRSQIGQVTCRNFKSHILSRFFHFSISRFSIFSVWSLRFLFYFPEIFYLKLSISILHLLNGLSTHTFVSWDLNFHIWGSLHACILCENLLPSNYPTPNLHHACDDRLFSYHHNSSNSINLPFITTMSNLCLSVSSSALVWTLLWAT